jgi:hypothetical protein
VVYVNVDHMYLKEQELAIKFTVTGYMPQNPLQALSFINAIFKCMTYDYTRIHDQDLSSLAAIIANLSQPVIHIASIPMNTYKLHLKQPLDQRDRFVHLFVDVGSPFKYIYVVYELESSKEKTEYRVEAFRPINTGSTPSRVTIFSTFYKEHPYVGEIVSNNVIHIKPGPKLEEKYKELLMKILSLSQTKECLISLYRNAGYEV